MKTLTRITAALGLAMLAFAPGTLAGADAEKAKKNDPNAPDELFDTPRVWQLKIEVPAAGVESLKRDPKEYVKATVRAADKVYADVGVRLKGGGGFQALDKKPSLTIKFNEFVSGTKFLGHSRVALNNAADDPSYLCEAIGGDLFRAADVPAPKTAFARVEINGRDQGLYVLAEAVNQNFLARYFKKPKGNLYEGANADVNEKLEQDAGEARDQADVKNLARAAQESDPGQRWKKLATVLDLDRFISFAAAEAFAWHHRGYALARDNYRLYADPASNQLVFIPHGLDQLFGKVNGPITNEWKGLVARAVLDTPEGQRKYRERLAQLLAGPWKTETLHARLNELAARARPGLGKDAAGVKAFDAAVAQLKERIAGRVKAVDAQLQAAAGK
jgi:spore coat protein CotH